MKIILWTIFIGAVILTMRYVVRKDEAEEEEFLKEMREAGFIQ